MRINIHKLQQSTQILLKNDAVVEIERMEGERERERDGLQTANYEYRLWMLKGLPQDASSSDGEGDPWGRLGLPYPKAFGYFW